MLLRIVEVLHSAYKAGHVHISDHIGFLVTLVAHKVFPSNSLAFYTQIIIPTFILVFYSSKNIQLKFFALLFNVSIGVFFLILQLFFMLLELIMDLSYNNMTTIPIAVKPLHWL